MNHGTSLGGGDIGRIVTLAELRTLVCQAVDVSESELMTRGCRLGVVTRARAVMCHAARRWTTCGLNEIAGAAGMASSGSVTRALRRADGDAAPVIDERLAAGGFVRPTPGENGRVRVGRLKSLSTERVRMNRERAPAAETSTGRMVDRFTVCGVPAPGGSKKVLPFRKGGRLVLVDDAKGNRGWRELVRVTCLAQRRSDGPVMFAALRVEAVFRMPRPKSHFVGGDARRGLRDGAPKFHAVRPDATKLWRSTEDAMTGVAWRDDAQVVEQRVVKRWCGEGEEPGVEVVVWEIGQRANEEGAA